MPLTLTIILNDNGTMSIDGPIHHLLLVFGMLELAKANLVKMHAEKENEDRRIQPVQMDLSKLGGN